MMMDLYEVTILSINYKCLPDGMCLLLSLVSVFLFLKNNFSYLFMCRVFVAVHAFL